MESPTSAIVFCRTRLEVDELTEAMNARGYRAEALHGGFAQEQRDRVMKRFRGGQTDLLVATDVAARGLDIEHVSHVVNYDVPTEPEAYVHRIGRTGRAGREGVAITFVEPREHRLLRNIQYATKQKIHVGALPTVNDLRNRRLELTRAALADAVAAGGLDPFRKLVEDLASEHDPFDVAAAAVKLAHQASHEEDAARADEQDIPTPYLPELRGRGPQRGRERPHGRPGERARGHGDERARGRPSERPRGRGGERAPERGGERERGARTWDRVRLFIGAGRVAGLRPADVVGAIANEAGVPGSAIGAIEIADDHTLVEVPADAAERVITALRRSKIRGRRAVVRRDGGE
jgi:ATP-dependent RNA helicase DeaD